MHQLTVVAAVDQAGDLRPRAPLGDLGNRLLAVAADHGVHVRTRLQPVTRILRRRPPAQNRHHPRRQRVDVVADQIKVLAPVDGIADQVGLRPEERLRAGRAFMPEVDQIDPLGIRAQRGGDVLQPQRREGCLRTARTSIGKDAQDVAKHGAQLQIRSDCTQSTDRTTQHAQDASALVRSSPPMPGEFMQENSGLYCAAAGWTTPKVTCQIHAVVNCRGGAPKCGESRTVRSADARFRLATRHPVPHPSLSVA